MPRLPRRLGQERLNLVLGLRHKRMVNDERGMMNDACVFQM